MIGFQSKSNSLSSLSQGPWNAESKQSHSSTERAGTDSSAASKNINGSDTDAHIDSVRLDIGVIHACPTHIGAEHAVSGHICTHRCICICYVYIYVVNRSRWGENMLWGSCGHWKHSHLSVPLESSQGKCIWVTSVSGKTCCDTAVLYWKLQMVPDSLRKVVWSKIPARARKSLCWLMPVVLVLMV